MEKLAHYCQKCRAANQPGESVCRRCGTPLMLVVIPPSVRHEDSISPSYYEDHLLERVSLLELRLSQVVDRLTLALDLMLRQAKTIESDRLLIETIVDGLNAAGVFGKEKEEPSEKSSKNSAAAAERKSRREIFKQILTRHDYPNAELFIGLVKEGAELLSAGEEKQGLRMLERAVKLSPRNVTLLIFTAENLFRADRFTDSEKYLRRAYELSPQEPKILLLLGVICADRGESETARQFLSLLINHRETNFCVNYIWAFLAAFEGKWTEALAAFKEALRGRDLPEIQYLTGCAYHQLRRPKQALKYLRQAVERDPDFSDAWFMLGTSLQSAGEKEKAAEAFKKASEIKESGAQSSEFMRRRQITELDAALPFLSMRRRPENILTGNARRLSKLFREELLKLL